MNKKRSTKVTGPLRIGVIGAGGMGQEYCRLLGGLPEARLTAVCDVGVEAARKVAETHGAVAFGDHRALIAAKVCDAVVVATPHPFHAQPAVDCMRTGLHALVEKPLSECVSQAEAMIRAARRSQVAFAVTFQRRFDPVFRCMQALIAAGRLGKIQRTTYISSEYRSQCYYDAGTWRATWKGEGGGVLINQAPHLLDWFVQLAGLPSEVYGRVETRLHKIEVEDQAEALLKYPDGGTGYLFCSTIEAGPGRLIEIFGDRGKLIWRDEIPRFYRFEPGIAEHIRTSDQMWGGPKVVEEPLDIPAANIGHRDVILNWVRHILHGEPLVCPGASGLASLELANAILLSSHQKRWLKLPIGRRAYDAFLAERRRRSTFVKRVRAVQRITDPKLQH